MIFNRNKSLRWTVNPLAKRLESFLCPKDHAGVEEHPLFGYQDTKVSVIGVCEPRLYHC